MTLRSLHDETPWWVKMLIPIVLSAIISMAVAFANTASSHDKDFEHRVSALEAHRADDTSRLDRIENKIDKMLVWAGVK